MFTLILAMMIAHLVSDTFLQSREEARGKSERASVLFKHVRTNFLVTFALLFAPRAVTSEWSANGLTVLVWAFQAFMPALLNALIHAVIDWNIWRLYKRVVSKRLQREARTEASYDDDRYEQIQKILEQKRLAFKYWEDPWFFRTIVIDQFLHYTTIVLIAAAVTA